MPIRNTILILRTGSWVLPIAACVLWGSVTYIDERQQAVAQAYENVALVRQYAQRLIDTQTILQNAALAHVRVQMDPNYLSTKVFHDFLAEVESSQSFTHGLAVVGFDGALIASSRSFPANRNLNQRDYLAATEVGTALFIDRITLEPGGQDALVVVQPFAHESFRGVIVSAIGVEAIRDFLARVAGRDGEAASLLREDGKLLVRHIPTKPMYLNPSSPSRQAMEKAPEGHYQAKAVSDGVERVYAYSKIGELPIYANFGTPTRLILSSWFWRAAPVWLLLFAGGAFSFVMAGFLERSLRERAAHQEQSRLRREAEQKAEQHERFMRELNHRVKNNLTLIDSLISLQMRKKTPLDGQDLRARIAAIADVHDLLYQAADSYQIDLGELLEKVCRSPALVPGERDITLDLHTDKGVIIEAGRATSLTLAVVELLTNAVKHAFPDNRSGTIAIQLHAQGEHAELVIADNGIGVPETTTRSSGTKIVEAFVHQVDGTLTRSSKDGTSYQVLFPINPTSGA